MLVPDVNIVCKHVYPVYPFKMGNYFPIYENKSVIIDLMHDIRVTVLYYILYVFIYFFLFTHYIVACFTCRCQCTVHCQHHNYCHGYTLL